MGDTIEGKLLYAASSANLIKNTTGLDIFKNTRRREYVELRSLLIFILKDVENMTLFSIRDFFRSNGKDYDHTTVLHAYNNYPIYVNYNKDLKKYFNMIVSNSNSINSKKLLAKQIIDSSDPTVAELFIYMANQ